MRRSCLLIETYLSFKVHDQLRTHISHQILGYTENKFKQLMFSSGKDSNTSSVRLFSKHQNYWGMVRGSERDVTKERMRIIPTVT